MFLRLWYWDVGGPVSTPAPLENFYVRHIQADGRTFRAFAGGRSFAIDADARGHAAASEGREFEVDAQGRRWRILN